LAERGAEYILGLDACELMIEATRDLPMKGIEYQKADVENLSFLSDETFDLAISYLNQCDLADFKANNREVWRVLKSGGRFIITNIHPMRSATGLWYKNDAGEKEHVILDNYFCEGERSFKMLGSDFTNYHRSLSTYVNNFIEVGFLVDVIIEPTVDHEALTIFPELDDELRVPNFIIYVLRKP
jgi:ubiquinone/menaquinone biosynthesis C-methylase UbiE